jgi:hypothetical protein
LILGQVMENLLGVRWLRYMREIKVCSVVQCREKGTFVKIFSGRNCLIFSDVEFVPEFYFEGR